MGKVQLKIPPFLASMLNAPGFDWLTIERDIEEGTKINDLLVDLALSDTNFRKAVFNPDVGKVSEQVHVILNNNLLQDVAVTEAILNDGDTVTLLPVYSGG